MPDEERAPKRPLHERLGDQFSYRGERANVWRAFDRFLDTDAYLNLGYSPGYLPHFVGSSQRRLVDVVGSGLADRLGETRGVRLLDVGCGRGGPAMALAGSFGFDVAGVDLVAYNVAAARRNAAREDVPTEFVLGDAARLPIAADAAGAATAIDSVVYVPDERAAFEELARVLRPGGVAAISDLLAREDVDRAARASVDAFAEAWDMPEIVPAGRYVDEVSAAGFVVDEVRDLSPHSVGRLRKWARLYLAAAERGRWLADRTLGRWDVDVGRITGQVRAAHDALPYLRHVLLFARNE